MFEVKPEVGKSRAKVLHRNLLLPLPCLPVEKSDTHNVETDPAVTVQEDAMADIVSNHESDVDVIVRQRRAPIPTPRRSRVGTPNSGVVRDWRPGSEEHTSDTTIAATPTEDSLASGHGSLEPLNPETERAVTGLG